MKDLHLIYDGTFDGFLSSVFTVFEYKIENAIIQKRDHVQPSFFSNMEEVITDRSKADRVWKGLKLKLSSQGLYHIYSTFLSEIDNVEGMLLYYIQYAFNSAHSIDKDYADPIVLKITQLSKSVGREKHRMEAFVRFRLTKDDIYFASIEPDFDVLPLISKHFKKRYADQKWIIYDINRYYGLFYDLQHVKVIELELPEAFDVTKSDPDIFTDKELEFQTLWKNYFDSTNIPSRKNMKLHIRHVPKRYWKYLSEKQPH